jgi:hypothetical protein
MSKSGNPNWVKGQSANPNGRKAGVPNKATKDIKAHYAALIEGNLDRIQSWLDRVAEQNPQAAIDLLIKLSPFVIPRNVSQEITFDSPIQIVIPPKPIDDRDLDNSDPEDFDSPFDPIHE